jgi:hypothetical protein
VAGCALAELRLRHNTLGGPAPGSVAPYSAPPPLSTTGDLVWVYDKTVGCWWPGEKLDPLAMPAGGRLPAVGPAPARPRSAAAMPGDTCCDGALSPLLRDSVNGLALLPAPPCRARPACGRGQGAVGHREAGQPAAVPEAGREGDAGAAAGEPPRAGLVPAGQQRAVAGEDGGCVLTGACPPGEASGCA